MSEPRPRLSDSAEEGPRPVNRCPRCAYRLDGLPGIPPLAYDPCTADTSCPECGLRIPLGSRCMVGASTVSGLEPSNARAIWPIVGFAAMAAATLTLFSLSAIRSSGPTPGFAIRNFAPILPALIGLAVPAFLLIRRYFTGRTLNVDRSVGGADVRALVEPGVLRVFRGGPTAKPLECAAADVQRITAVAAWRFFPKANAPGIMALRFHLPASTGALAQLGIVTGHFLVPRGALAAELARQVTATLRMEPTDPAAVPPVRTAPTPSLPPVCPQCAKTLVDAPHAAGPWRQALTGAVECARCGFTAAAGSYVLSGWPTAVAGLSPGRRRALHWTVGASVIVFALIAAALIALVPFGLWVVVTVEAFTALLVMGMIVVVVRIVRDPRAPRPEGRFQPGGTVWIVEPGQLSIVERGKRGSAPTRAVRIPARGITRLEFGTWDPDSSNSLGVDTLLARGTAPELGLVGMRHIALAVHAGVERDQFAQELTRTLKRLPASAPGGPA